MVLIAVLRSMAANVLGRIVAVAVVLGAVGVAGYMIIEGWSFLDAAFMTVLTFTTVGYQEVHPLSDGGKIFSIFLMITGVGVFMFGFTTVARTVVEEGAFRAMVHRRRMRTRMAGLQDHVIVCGFGRVGREVVATLLQEKTQVIVIDSDSQAVADLDDRNILFVQGDATLDETLILAGVAKARAIIVAVGSDSDSVLITLSASTLNADASIVARTTLGENEGKLRRAGATRVVSPYSIGGRRLAFSAVRPASIDYFETMMGSSQGDERIEELLVESGTRLDGFTIGNIERDSGLHILAHRQSGKRLQVSPDAITEVHAGDRLVVYGSSEQFDSVGG